MLQSQNGLLPTRSLYAKAFFSNVSYYLLKSDNTFLKHPTHHNITTLNTFLKIWKAQAFMSSNFQF